MFFVFRRCLKMLRISFEYFNKKKGVKKMVQIKFQLFNKNNRIDGG
ncbi:hypothetical protein GCM10008935_23620 [Alkalibacillus silvisoli]|uniref:Uncharacterized protein n=1 Tax=Alkalibacillus silvisoli TaxID=392823 RepID=A0ABP3K1S2_9BACI